MKILHTSDWHLGDRLGQRRIERRFELQDSLAQIARYLEEHRVDVMLVSGDIFSDQLRMEERREAIGDIKQNFLPFLQRGGTILAISGNHDSELFFNTLHDALELVSGRLSGISNTDPTGRIYLFSYPKVIRLADAQGEIVQFALMPYPTPRHYLRGEEGEYNSIEEKHLKLKAKFTKTFEGLVEKQIDKELPCVLVSHLHVQGVTMHNLFRPTEADGMLFSRRDLPTSWAYVACGHIHKPQAIFDGSEQIRYAGSIARMDLGEAKDEKSAVLIEIKNKARLGAPVLLPLKTTPIYEVEITDPTQIPHLKTRFPNAQTDLVRYILQLEPGYTPHRDELCRDIQALFPNWYDRKIERVGLGGTQSVSGIPKQLESVEATVLDYFERINDPNKARLIEATKDLLKEGGWQ